MTPAADRFIELATRPLADNAELHLIAKGELRQRLEQNAASEQSLTEAANALARADQHPRRHWWRPALYLTTLLVSLPILTHSFRLFHQFRDSAYVQNLLSPSWGSFGGSSNPIKHTYPPNQELLLFGDESASNNTDRWKPLWDSEPENPAYLAQYAVAFFGDHNTLSPEILEAAARIDSDNGWYATMAAAGLAETAANRAPRSPQEKKDLKTPVWKILSRKQLEDSLALLHQAAEKPVFTSYEESLIKQRIPLLPQRRDCVSQMAPVAYLASHTSATVHLRRLVDAMSAGAQECAAQNDITGFRQLVADWQKLARKSVSSGYTLIDLLVAKIVYFGPAENFRDAASSLGLDEEAGRFSRIHEQKKADKDAREKRRKQESEFNQLISEHGSLFAGLTLPLLEQLVDSPPPLTDADLQPSRYADYALYSRIVSVLAWAMLGFCAGLAALQRFRQGLLIRSLSGRMMDLLRPADWIIILAGGILVPILWFGVITRLTPLSAREWSFRSSGFIQASGQVRTLITMMTILPVVISAQRLGMRGKGLNLRVRRPWIGWIAIIAATLALPTYGAMMLSGPLSSMVLNLAFVLEGIAAIWLLVGFFRNILGKPVHALRRATLARTVLPAWIFGMLVMIATVPLHYMEERHWVRQDRLFEITPEAPAMSRYEWEVTQVLRKELLEMME